MRASMLSLLAVLTMCVHCGGKEPPKGPAPAPEEAAETAADVVPEPEPEPAPAPEPEPEPAPAPTPKAKPAKIVCSELKENRCKVTEGCAWNTVNHCIEEDL